MNQIFTHPGQPEMQAEVILASRSTVEGAPPIITMRLRYPRIIHGEIMTHRLFSRNARSSRAVPVKTMLNEVRNTPFVPWHWGKNQRGMQADEECNESLNIPPHLYGVDRETAWLHARDTAVQVAEAYMNAGYHKQIPNRLLEPFSWIDTLITSTDWQNFLWLRDHGDAEPHLIDLARLVKQAINAAEYQTLVPGQWHLPYITDEDARWAESQQDHESAPSVNEILAMISAARCARISYKPFDGDATYEREFDRYNLLVTSDQVHASPTEHQASPDRKVRMQLIEDDGYVRDSGQMWIAPGLHGNFEGWIQARKLIPNERCKEAD